MAESFGARCSKCVLFLFNFLFWLSGAALLGLGIWLMVDKNVLSYIDIVTWDSSDPYLDVVAYVLIGTGSFIFLVGFCGCCGALRESRGLIALYVFFILLVIILELAAGIIAVVFRGKIEDLLQESMEKQIEEKYEFVTPHNETGVINHGTINLAWDRVQHQLKCCGVHDYSDWESSSWRDTAIYINASYQWVPKTCCALSNDDPENPRPADLDLCQMEAKMNNGTFTQLYSEGCYNKMKDWVKDNATLLITVGASIAAVQLFGLMFACYLGFKIKQEMSVGTYA